jgi:regulatory protein
MTEFPQRPKGENPTPPPDNPWRDALRSLSRRPLTCAEIRQRLAKRGHAPQAVEETLVELKESRLLDDKALSVDYIVLRASRLGHGRSRLLRDLERRGVDSAIAEQAWHTALSDNDIDPEEVLRRQVTKQVERSGGHLEPRAYRRVYNALLRGGHDAGSVIQALRPYRCYPGSDQA